MLPFIGSIASSWCAALLRRHQTIQEDLDGGILAIVGLQMPGRGRSVVPKVLGGVSNKDEVASQVSNVAEVAGFSVGDSTANMNRMMPTEDVPQFREILSRSTDSLYPPDSDQFVSNIRRDSCASNVPMHRRRSSMRSRSTIEEISAELSRRPSQYHRPAYVTPRIDLVSGRSIDFSQ
ncbi:unnamed protein product [Gongylonema pulchrum]|uniref:Movement protein n=1 Tax=Gongylonema pulchrum TaxID=637853 RepID=A0A183D3Q2_9BILA|nr:unnamed protein product [Gongylonema pulchrum]